VLGYRQYAGVVVCYAAPVDEPPYEPETKLAGMKMLRTMLDEAIRDEEARVLVAARSEYEAAQAAGPVTTGKRSKARRVKAHGR
jgi:hypothetical protein